MKDTFRLMIIDDSWEERKATYRSVLGEDIEIIDNCNQENIYLKILQEEVDAYLIDIVLDNWMEDSRPQELIPILEKLKSGKPIFLVSRQYSTLIKNNKLTKTINEIIEKEIAISSFFVYQDFEKAEALLRNENVTNRFTQNIPNTIKFNILTKLKENYVKLNNEADVGIVCALQTELKPFVDKLEEADEDNIENGKIKFTRGVISTNKGEKIKVIAVHQENMGTVDAAFESYSIAREFNLKHLFMIGVCGGREGQVKIGDIIIPGSIIAYQKGKITDEGMLMNPSTINTHVNLKQTFQGKCDGVLKDIWKSFVDTAMERDNEILAMTTPKINFNELVCGENVVNRDGEIEKIAKDMNKPKLAGIDMESYSIYRLNLKVDIKTIVMKSVMDLTKSKSDKYKKYASYVSANFLYEVLRRGIYNI